jgi:hypothetical protein
MHLHTISGFVEQDDIVIPELTVRQSLMFTAALRMGVSAGKGGQRARVEEVISELRLTKCADTLVGAAGARGISGGERSESANPCSASTHVSPAASPLALRGVPLTRAPVRCSRLQNGSVLGQRS